MKCKQDDDYLVCGDCGEQCINGDCPDHGPLEWVNDCNPVSGTPQKNQARGTLPSNLYLMPSAVGQGQMGVFARARIEKRVMFGPFRGQKVPAQELHFGEDHSHMYMWDILEGDKVSHIVDGSDEQHSNWMRFVNCARDNKEQNLVAVQFHGEIYYKTCSCVESGSELLMWYDDSVSLEIDNSTQKVQNGHDFVCDVCGLVFPGSTFLLRHKSVRCPGKSADQTSTCTSHDQAAQADEPVLPSDAEKANSEDATLPCDAESPYVVVHIGATGNENNNRVVEEPNSPYVVVHVEPAPSSGVSTTGRLRKGKQASTPQVNGKKSNEANTRKRSAESARKTKQIASKSTLSKARKATSSNGAKAQNTSPTKSTSSKKTPSGTKRKATSAATGSEPSPRGSVDKVKKRKGTEPNESQTQKKAKQSASSGEESKVSGSGEDTDKINADEDESIEEHTAGKASPKSGTKSNTQEVNKKSSSSRKRPLEEEEETPTAENGSVPKRSRKKTPRKVKRHRVKESDGDPSNPSKKPSPAKKKRAAPEDKPIFTCEKCLRTFKWKSQLDYHLRRHATEKEFKCTFCDKGLSQLSSLKRHLRVHSGEKPYECKECGKRFVEKGKLNYHQRKHTGEQMEKKYKCSVCDRGFTLSANLTTHMRTHTGERPFPCPQCGKGFKRSSDIICHLRSHTGERPYKCSHCEKSFTMISHRNRHEVIHSGVRPFKCNVCGKGFTQPNSVKAHLKVHSRNQPRLEGREPRQAQQERTHKDEEMQTDAQPGEGQLRQGVPQSSGSEQLQMSSALQNGTQESGVASAAGDSTEALQSVISEMMETEHLKLDSAQGAGSEHTQGNQDNGAKLVQLDRTQALQPEHLNVQSSEVDRIEGQEILSRDGTELTTIATEQLHLSCNTTDEERNIDNTLINGKELLQLSSAAQSSGTEHLQLELTPSSEQEQVLVQLAVGNETTLLVL